MHWPRALRVALILVGVVNVAIYFLGGEPRIILAGGVIAICGGTVILGYVKDPGSFHRPVRGSRWRRHH